MSSPTPIQQAAARVAHEDLVVFLNACFACSGQREFYSDGHQQTVSIAFLHDYIRGNYRRLYARSLAAGVNHFNQGRIVLELLSHSRDLDPETRREEGQLCRAVLRELPPQRAYRVLLGLRERGVNNRRTRAIVREFLAQRRDLAFDALKYRSKLHGLVRHAHPPLPGELGPFLARSWQARRYSTPLLEQFRKAHYAAEAVYELPFTVAEGLAVKHKIPRALFLQRIAPRLTAHERLRLQSAAARADVDLDFDLERAPLTRLALHILALPPDDRRARSEALHAALAASARRTLRAAPLPLGKVAAVLDRSYSTAGSRDKPRRPLAIALAVDQLLAAAAREYMSFWTGPPPADPLLLDPRGQTDLATPLLDALAWQPDLVVIVSDGFDNDPPRGAGEVCRVFRSRLDPARRTTIVHVNPVFDAPHLGPKPLDRSVPTVGLRDAEDLATVLAFARFADGGTSLAELEDYLAARANALLSRHAPGAAP
ncbi:hypothetical protein [Nannocystis sp.]|uniref:hypothetical protein n=1 Tax=Nannocystis sp. TaxID=1962667 RepID=UPI0025D1247E|nr:hypothetical protein [Nannocystis sp.]